MKTLFFGKLKSVTLLWSLEWMKIILGKLNFFFQTSAMFRKFLKVFTKKIFFLTKLIHSQTDRTVIKWPFFFHWHTIYNSIIKCACWRGGFFTRVSFQIFNFLDSYSGSVEGKFFMGRHFIKYIEKDVLYLWCFLEANKRWKSCKAEYNFYQHQ